MYSDERQIKSRDNARGYMHSMNYSQGQQHNTIDQKAYQLETKLGQDERPGSQRNFTQIASKTTTHDADWKAQVKLNRYLSGNQTLGN